MQSAIAPLPLNQSMDKDSDRRQVDEGWSVPPSLLPCPQCGTGTADLLAFISEGRAARVLYNCRDCDHQFSMIEPDAPSR